MTGDRARLRCGYQLAARLDRWRVTTDQTILGTRLVQIKGRVAWLDGFWICQGPFRLAVDLDLRTAWEWAVVLPPRERVIVGGTLVLTAEGMPIVVQEASRR